MTMLRAITMSTTGGMVVAYHNVDYKRHGGGGVPLQKLKILSLVANNRMLLARSRACITAIR